MEHLISKFFARILGVIPALWPALLFFLLITPALSEERVGDFGIPIFEIESSEFIAASSLQPIPPGTVLTTIDQIKSYLRQVFGPNISDSLLDFYAKVFEKNLTSSYDWNSLIDYITDLCTKPSRIGRPRFDDRFLRVAWAYILIRSKLSSSQQAQLDDLVFERLLNILRRAKFQDPSRIGWYLVERRKAYAAYLVGILFPLRTQDQNITEIEIFPFVTGKGSIRYKRDKFIFTLNWEDAVFAKGRWESPVGTLLGLSSMNVPQETQQLASDHVVRFFKCLLGETAYTNRPRNPLTGFLLTSRPIILWSIQWLLAASLQLLSPENADRLLTTLQNLLATRTEHSSAVQRLLSATLFESDFRVLPEKFRTPYEEFVRKVLQATPAVAICSDAVMGVPEKSQKGIPKQAVLWTE